MDAAEVLSEVAIDNFQFKITRSPVATEACILWIRDTGLASCFEALGQFSEFDRRNILFFIARYVTSPALRAEIDAQRFERKIAGLAPTFFREIERMSGRDKEKACRHLFNLDDQMNTLSLSSRRRIMANKFHPDVGGDHFAMVMINEAYEFLSRASAN